MISVAVGLELVGIDDFLLWMNTFLDHFDHDRCDCDDNHDHDLDHVIGRNLLNDPGNYCKNLLNDLEICCKNLLNDPGNCKNLLNDLEICKNLLSDLGICNLNLLIDHEILDDYCDHHPIEENEIDLDLLAAVVFRF